MTILRSSLNPEEQPDGIQGPTEYKAGPNQSELPCAICNRIYYVDETTLGHALSAMTEGLENPFYCDECEEEHDEISH